MKRTPKHVGLDVHAATTVVEVQNAGGRVIAQTVLPTDAAALVEYFRGMRGPIRVAFEEGTQAQWLHDLLTPLVEQVTVCDRRGETKRGNKGDEPDAHYLADGVRQGTLRAVFHGRRDRTTLKEVTRAYQNIVDDTTRVMSRLKALFRARGIRTSRALYHPAQRAQWVTQLPNAGARLRARALYRELDVLRELHPKVKAALIAEARRDPAWAVLQTIPFLGPIRVALVLATMQTPWRFRTKRNLWGYAGLAVVTHTTAEWGFVEGRPVRRRRPPMTRGLNRNHNPALKHLLKAAATAATVRPGPFKDIYERMLKQGMRAELARVTLARKFAAVILHLWKTETPFDATTLISRAAR